MNMARKDRNDCFRIWKTKKGNFKKKCFLYPKVEHFKPILYEIKAENENL